MKKVFIAIFVFAIIAFFTTGILINIKNNSYTIADDEAENNNFQNDNQEKDSVDVGNITSPLEEKTIDLFGTYDENDLRIEEASLNEIIGSTKVECNIPQISGLKDKSVEKKINDDIKNRIIESLEEALEGENVNEITKSRIDILSNFSNVLSIEVCFEKATWQYFGYTCLNYELINGERLEFGDLFKSDADLNNILRQIFYKMMIINTNGSIEYDKEKKEWIIEHWKYNEDTGFEEFIKEVYEPVITENDINKKIKAFMKDDNKQFAFSPARLYLDQAYGDNIEFKEIANDVVIYDKYLVEETIYEESNIGMKNIWTCSIPFVNDNSFMEYNFAEDNLFYELQINDNNYYGEEVFSFEKNVDKLKEETKNLLENKLEEYRKIARENPDKFYILYLNSNMLYEKDVSLILNGVFERLIYTDITEKERAIEKIMECYRYYNIGFYQSAMNLIYRGGEAGDIGPQIVWHPVEEKKNDKIFNLQNLKEITSIEEVFRENVDYIFIIKEKLREELKNNWDYQNASDEKINSALDNAEFTLKYYGIEATLDGNFLDTIYFSSLDKSLLMIYDINIYIIPQSNTQKIKKEEIQDLTLDELNKAYNEIFARHGHDFKNEELKEYFEGLVWYNPIKNKSVSIEELNDIEKYNLDIIRSVIDEKRI